MLKNQKAEKLLSQISAVFNDTEAAQDQELQTKLLACAQELEKTENYLVVATKVNAVARSAARRHLKQPIKAINTLYEQTARTAGYYDGLATVIMTSGLN
ncbi:bacteriocin immunity protein [Lactiplantibacillus daowaiensis]|uniref:Bacteriocin immunity protein n=1 Tax=Lactiplantibacillus daowaiensis TaxID=2559918 RepID=A0ABW1RZ78_9LACO|nr:bacteriocin immunity protein [Lactiplantibacillus daowaiensis]